MLSREEVSRIYRMFTGPWHLGKTCSEGKQLLVLGVSTFQCIRASFLYPKCDYFAKIKMSFI